MNPKLALLLLTLCLFSTNAFSQSAATDPLTTPFADREIKTVPSFNSCSYYFRLPDVVLPYVHVSYKRVDEPNWHRAHPTVWDQPEKIHKGSLFNLDEDTEYQIRITGTIASPPSNFRLSTTFRTWRSDPPIAKTIDLSTIPSTASDGIVITEQGTPDGWIKYTAPADWVVRRTLRDNDRQEGAIVLTEAKYIILENLTVEGGHRHAILVDNCDFVRILNCDLSGWGRVGEQRFDEVERSGVYYDAAGRMINYDAGVYIRRSFGTVVERCYVHDPRGRSTPWMFSHAAGPQAIVVDHTRGGNVVRWNDFVGSDEHRWNDVIECLSNSSPIGGFYRDSDIIGNFLAFANDDGVELEGGGINLRFIGNKVEGVLCGISFGASIVGPQYAIGNLIVNLGDEADLALVNFKNSHGVRQGGKRFVYNNTLHGFEITGGVYGGYGPATPVDAGLGTMRNNIFVCNDSYRPGDWTRAESFDNNLHWINHSQSASEQFVASFRRFGQEQNAIIGDPLFVDPAAANFRLSPESPARGKAVEIPGITRAGDNLGAFFNNATDLPLRPLALVASPAELNFPETGGSNTVTLHLPANAAAPIEFQIRQNNVFDWFTVTPANGTINPGETLTLTVTADPTKLTGRPKFRGAFLARTPNGLSRPVSVYAKGVYTEDKRPASAGPNTVYLETRDGNVDTQINLPGAGNYSLLVRTPRGPQRFEVAINNKNLNFPMPGYQWSAGQSAERVVWLQPLGQLNAGANQVKINYTGPANTIVEYIITDNPAVFFVQERNVRR
ncbi:MAG: hypothetical protein FWE95_04850 [Planctomycetaceae bacterium]|nr:hypothetical protein [Planctomycetaceae bacterium]